MIEVSSSNFYLKYFVVIFSIFSFAQNKIDTIQNLDLSNKNLKEIPNLSKKVIKKLDLSNNKIKVIDFENLPKNLEIINLSNNKLKGKIILLNKTNFLNLNKVILKNNKIDSLIFDKCIKYLDVSFNNLKYINLNLECENIKYLDISNNKKLDPIKDVVISTIKIGTLKRENLLNNNLISLRFETKETNPNLKLISAEELQKNK